MIRLYRLLTWWGRPLIWLWVAWRGFGGKEDWARLGERRGRAGVARPDGKLVWIHAASVGESISILALVDELIERDRRVLVTTGSVTSASVMRQRLPEGALHQFIPLDVAAYARRFLAHWKPNLAVFAESELWPNLITELKKIGCPAILINARMSDRSFTRWRRWTSFANELLLGFRYCLAQSTRDADNFRSLGAREVYEVGNLKYSAPSLPVDQKTLALLAEQCRHRTVWLLASSHPGEEELGLEVHKALAQSIPGLLTVVAPRHPHRGRSVVSILRRSGLAVTCRSEHPFPRARDKLYVVDTIGELGLFFRIAKVACIGGSLVARGGHNPLEPLRLGCAVICGPHMFNFEQITAELEMAGAVQIVSGAHGLALTVADLLSHEAARLQSLVEAQKVIARNQYPLERTVDILEQCL